MISWIASALAAVLLAAGADKKLTSIEESWVAALTGQQLASKVAFTDTFVKRNGKWRAVASHRSPVR